MKLDEIRIQLEACENSIIFALCERNRWCRNLQAYGSSTSSESVPIVTPTSPTSLFYRLLEGTETVHASVGRYACPEEHPFTTIPEESTGGTLPKSYHIGTFLDPEETRINHNDRIIHLYFQTILPMITEPGSCENPGSSVTADVHLLQAMSRRIHLGKVVAESKYRRDPHLFSPTSSDQELLEQLTHIEVENRILDRIRTKVRRLEGQSSPPSIWSERVVSVFRDIIIPETKQIQISYLRAKWK